MCVQMLGKEELEKNGHGSEGGRIDMYIGTYIQITSSENRTHSLPKVLTKRINRAAVDHLKTAMETSRLPSLCARQSHSMPYLAPPAPPSIFATPTKDDQQVFQ
jgi:hypothetical protein